MPFLHEEYMDTDEHISIRRWRSQGRHVLTLTHIWHLCLVPTLIRNWRCVMALALALEMWVSLICDTFLVWRSWSRRQNELDSAFVACWGISVGKWWDCAVDAIWRISRKCATAEAASSNTNVMDSRVVVLKTKMKTIINGNDDTGIRNNSNFTFKL